ncbi:hypothetical protein ACSBR1_027853 [Camellia fascicularis]
MLYDVVPKLLEERGGLYEASSRKSSEIAVKRLDKLDQGMKEFFVEVETLGHIHHVNLVRLIGFCAEKSCRLLVNEYMTNGSLDNWILWNNQRPCLNWQRDECHVLTRMRGTLGCITLEWRQARVTIKADIYSFGIVLLEIVSGHRNFDNTQSESRKHLLQVLRERVEYELLDMVENMDEGVKQYHAEEVNDQSIRPSMSIVVKVLKGLMEVETNINYNFTYETTFSSTVNNHASITPPALVEKGIRVDLGVIGWGFEVENLIFRGL